MVKIIYVKTTRTKHGYAQAKLHKFMDYSRNKMCYSFQFYQKHEFFDTYKELRNYVETNYDLINSFDHSEYHLPEDKNECFN